MRDLIDQMLSMLDRQSWSIDEGGDHLSVTLAGTRLEFDAGASTNTFVFEKLAEAIRWALAVQRARRMIEAAGMTSEPVPLWMVSGSNILGGWLRYAGAGNAFRKALSLTDVTYLAPVTGDLDRRARRDLEQGGARIRVRGAMAVAERIELSNQPRCIAMLGERAFIRFEDYRLPNTVIAALQQHTGRNAGRPLSDVVGHPFFAAANLTITDVVQDETVLTFQVHHTFGPLEPVPEAAWKVLPRDPDPMFPWEANMGEQRRLIGLVAEARHRAAAMRGQR